MDTTILIIGAGLLFGSLVLSAGIELVLRRLGVQPADSGDRSRGILDVFQSLRRRLRERGSSGDPPR